MTEFFLATDQYSRKRSSRDDEEDDDDEEEMQVAMHTFQTASLHRYLFLKFKQLYTSTSGSWKQRSAPLLSIDLAPTFVKTNLLIHF